MATRGAAQLGTGAGFSTIVVNANARRGAGVKAGDFVTITLEPDTEKRDLVSALAEVWRVLPD